MGTGLGSKQGRGQYKPGPRAVAPPAAREGPDGRRLARGVARPRLARVSHVSEAHFARAFKEAFGVPPHRYLLTRRIEKATALLRDTELSITEIAFETGWSSLGTFTRTFRDITDETPGELRAREKAAPHELEHVPGCWLSAAHRPDLTIAVSEKRRQDAIDTVASNEKTEVP